MKSDRFEERMRASEMNAADLEDEMRSLEVYHGLIVPPGAYVAVRVDGRAFHTLTASMKKPFDESFRDQMVEVARVLLKQLGGAYAYTESDEVSVFLLPESDLFGRSVEKLVSISAGLASAAFSLGAGTHAAFDARVIVLPTLRQVVDYARWRAADAARCCLNGWAYWTLRKEGLSARQATRQLEGRPASLKHELLFQRGVNFNDLPAWQRRGIGLYWETYQKPGVNRLTGEATLTTRRRIRVDRELPMGDAYAVRLRALLTASCPAPVRSS